MRGLTILAILGGLVLPPGVCRADDARQEEKRLQGTWEIVEQLQDGRPAPRHFTEGARIVIAGDTLTMIFPDKHLPPRKFRFTLDPKQSPPALDARWLDGSYAGETSPGIYKLEDDKLLWRLAVPGQPRPTKFASTEGSKTSLLTLRRAKP
jgi:uncharacterized protein (TIGR03067 family)